jgi:hypothetical protein
MTRLWLPLLLLLSLPALAQEEGENRKKRSYPDSVVAIVEGTPITGHELELTCLLRSDYRRVAEGPDRLAIRTFELEELIKQRVLLEKVKQEKIEFTEDDQKRLDWELTRRAQDRRGVDGLKTDLESIGVPFPYFVTRQRSNILVFKLLTKVISRDIFIAPEEIRRTYEREKAKRFMRDGEVRLRQIALYPSPGAAYRSSPKALEEELKDWNAERCIRRLRARVLAGESFKELAAQCSMGVHHSEELVYSSKTDLEDVFPSPVGGRIAELEVGKVSEVIVATDNSLHLLLVEGRRDPGPLPLEEVQEQITAALKSTIWNGRVADYIRSVRETAFVRKFLKP